ncbi:MAG: hypothetical protein H0X66_02195 [Verrucomicrobia bacterium]|nr:hypothetical protein [Verrucomicrobiota bacterium]
MRNEAADIAQETAEESPEWKYKAKVAGTAAVDATKAAYNELHDRTLEYSKATDQAIRQRPYVSLGIIFGAGCLLGFLMGRGGSGKECED